MDLILLAVLQAGWRHGYAIQREVELGIGWKVPWATLYPMLHALEAKGWAGVRHDPAATSKRPRRQYQLTPAGRAELKRQAVQWQTGVARWQAVVLPALRSVVQAEAAGRG